MEPCEICGNIMKRAGRKAVPLLECDKCLRGFHLDCLQPPLFKVPEVRIFSERCVWKCHLQRLYQARLATAAHRPAWPAGGLGLRRLPGWLQQPSSAQSSPDCQRKVCGRAVVPGPDRGSVAGSRGHYLVCWQVVLPPRRDAHRQAGEWGTGRAGRMSQGPAQKPLGA